MKGKLGDCKYEMTVQHFYLHTNEKEKVGD